MIKQLLIGLVFGLTAALFVVGAAMLEDDVVRYADDLGFVYEAR